MKDVEFTKFGPYEQISDLSAILNQININYCDDSQGLLQLPHKVFSSFEIMTNENLSTPP